MRNMRHFQLCLVLLAIVSTVHAQEGKHGKNGQKTLSPKEAKWEAVKQYILKDEYPELFGDKPYRLKINNAIIEDVDGDGQDDVIVHVTPHYLQSPTIILFKVSKNLKVTRVKEGLAPGPLVPLNGDFLDSHTLGSGMDLTLGKDQKDPTKRMAMIQAAFKNKMGGVVEYANFIHVDGRTGKGIYVDMTGLATPPEGDNCAKFQFSMPEEIAVLPKNDGSGNYLLARVGKQIYQYKIHKIRDDGFLEKTLVIKPAP